MKTVELHSLGDVSLLLAKGMEVEDLQSAPLVVRKNGTYLTDTGALIPIGGAATDENLRVVRQFVREDTDITVITAPTSKPDEVFEELEHRFRRVNHIGEVYHLRFDTTREHARKMLSRSSVIYISGGDQQKAMEVLEKEGVDTEIQHFYQDERNTIAGSSAGASLMGAQSPHGKDFMRGLGLTPLTIDQHTGERERQWRVKKAAQRTSRSAIGFNEGTGGIIYRNSSEIHVFGATSAHVAWQPNGHVESADIQRGFAVEVPVLTGDHASQPTFIRNH